MNEGMLWLDDTKERTIEDKIGRALIWYKENYGPKPNLCFVHQKIEAENVEIEGIDIRPASFIQPNHFWIGSAA